MLDRSARRATRQIDTGRARRRIRGTPGDLLSIQPVESGASHGFKSGHAGRANVSAVAAISPSRSGWGSGPCGRALRRTTAVSTGSRRSAKVGKTCSSSPPRMIAPWARSFRSSCKPTVSSSCTVMAERKATVPERLNPGGDIGTSGAGPRLSQLPDDVGVEQNHQERSGGRAGSRKRGNFSAMSSTPAGPPRASAMLRRLPVMR